MHSFVIPFALGAAAVQAAMVETAPHRIRKHGQDRAREHGQDPEIPLTNLVAESSADSTKSSATILNGGHTGTAGHKKLGNKKYNKAISDGMHNHDDSNWGLTERVISPNMRIEYSVDDTVLINSEKAGTDLGDGETFMAFFDGYKGKLTQECSWDLDCGVTTDIKSHCIVELDNYMNGNEPFVKTLFAAMGKTLPDGMEKFGNYSGAMQDVSLAELGPHVNPDLFLGEDLRAIMGEDLRSEKVSRVLTFDNYHMNENNFRDAKIWNQDGMWYVSITFGITQLAVCHRNLYPAAFVGWEADNMHTQFIGVSLTMHEYRLTFNAVEQEHMMCTNEVVANDLHYKEEEIKYHQKVYDAQAMNAISDLWQLASRMIAAVLRQSFIEKHIAPALLTFDDNGITYAQFVERAGKTNSYNFYDGAGQPGQFDMKTMFSPSFGTSMLKRITEQAPNSVLNNDGRYIDSSMKYDWNDHNATTNYGEASSTFGQRANARLHGWTTMAKKMEEHNVDSVASRDFYGTNSIIDAANLHADRIHFETLALDLMTKIMEHFDDICNDKAVSEVISRGLPSPMCDDVQNLRNRVDDLVDSFEQSKAKRWDGERKYDTSQDAIKTVHELIALAEHVVKGAESSLRSSEDVHLGSYITVTEEESEMGFAEYIEVHPDKHSAPQKVMESAYKFLLIEARKAHLNYFSAKADLRAAQAKCDEILNQKLRVEIQLNDAMTILQTLFDQVRYAYGTFHRQGDIKLAPCDLGSSVRFNTCTPDAQGVVTIDVINSGNLCMYDPYTSIVSRRSTIKLSLPDDRLNGFCPPFNCIPETKWGNWSKCSQHCGDGEKTHRRDVRIPDAFNGQPCSDSDLSETGYCSAGPCPIDCVVGNWSAWSTCSRPCNGGFRERTREVIQKRQFGGEECPSERESSRCNKHSCAIDCIGEWSDWSKCNKECGGGVQNRTLHIVREAAHGGTGCDRPSEEIGACNTAPCDRNCVLGKWSQWSDCSAGCGGGVTSRSRQLLQEAVGGGSCDQQSEDAVCNVHSCDVDCVLGGWSKWSACVGGLQNKTRSISIRPQGSGNCAAKNGPDRFEQQACTECQAAKSIKITIDIDQSEKVRVLNLAEVRVFGPGNKPIPRELLKMELSSVWEDCSRLYRRENDDCLGLLGADYCNDGRDDTFCHSLRSPGQPQWLEVTFKNVPMAIERVEVTNRVCHSFGDDTFGEGDCDKSASYISGASLQVFDASSNPLWSNAFPKCESLQCNNLKPGGEPGGVFTFTESDSKTAHCSDGN